MDPQYKAILVKNETRNSKVLLRLFYRFDPICWLPFQSETIEPGKQYFHRDKCAFKYVIYVHAQTVVPVKMFDKDKLISIKDVADGGVVADEENLSEYPDEWKICVIRKNMKGETAAKLGRNLYIILKLDIKTVRKMTIEDQDRIIKKAYHSQMRLFHPDCNPDVADNHICQEIIMAYSILGDRQKRAQYHDLTDYSGGWLSTSRWKAIFKPESHGSGEKFKRIGLLFISVACLAGGLALTILTGGLAGPVLFIGCKMAGGALVNGAIQGAFRTVSRDTIENGVKLKMYAKSFAIGAVIGGISCGISSFLVMSEVIPEITADFVLNEEPAVLLERGAAEVQFAAHRSFAIRSFDPDLEEEDPYPSVEQSR